MSVAGKIKDTWAQGGIKVELPSQIVLRRD